MKTVWPFLATLEILTSIAGQSTRAQSTASTWPNERRPVADFSHGRRFARTMTGEDPAFRKAIDALDAQSGKVMRGTGLVPAAVSAQTHVPIGTLDAQQTETGLSYGELLVADSLAVGSGKSFARILAMRAKSQTWAELSLKLRINPNSIIARAHAAKDAIKYAQARFDRRHRESIYGLDVLRTQNSQNVPRLFARAIPGR
jgi:hypothetical protein